MQQTLKIKTEHRQEKGLDELKDTFIQHIQHELRTPVSIILGYADLLQSGTLGTLAEQQQEALSTITGQAGVLRTLVERITTLLDVAAYEITPYPVNTGDIATSIVVTYQQQAVQAGLTLTAKLAPQLPLVLGNPGYLKQAVECLVENALKFTPAGGQVEVIGEVQQDWVCLSVIDTGIGIASEQLEHVFDTFFQVDNSLTRPCNGLGLGLAVAKAVIEAHGGHIEVESQPGQGSRFTVKLPPLPVSTYLEQNSLPPAHPHRILIVDDEPFVALSLQEGLEKLPNCEVVIATSGQEALQYFDQRPFDLMITDYRMPDIDGVTLTARVRQGYPQAATIIITGYGDHLPREQITGVPILDKPVKLAEIRSATLQTLENRVLAK